ncbi:polyphenol oxidase family protein [Ningiella sp. W23]|uniref:polyphenol oxidase family protein n=1 Tax=Ningiella sp. W23 TaxID=3023715 RepID=UPI0037583EE8
MNVIRPERKLAPNVECFTSTRQGGLSSAPYESMNLAKHVNDTVANVEENRKRLHAFILNQTKHGTATHIHRPVYLTQCHSSRVADFDKSSDIDTQSYDAVISHRVGNPLLIMTADCLPIVIVDGHSPNQHQSEFRYAAIHAGWRGLADNIIAKTLASFDRPLNNPRVWIGPHICAKHFETGGDVVDQLSPYTQSVARNQQTQKYHVDLADIASQQMRQEGIKDIQVSQQCTYCNDILFSFRQAHHMKQADCGRMATVVLAY